MRLDAAFSNAPDINRHYVLPVCSASFVMAERRPGGDRQWPHEFMFGHGCHSKHVHLSFVTVLVLVQVVSWSHK
jgi:hypothetical protein